MKRYIFFSLCCVLIRSGLSQNTGPLTLSLEDAIQMALSRNIDIALAQTNLETFQSRYKEVIGSAIPDFTAKADYTRNILRQAAFFPATPPNSGTQKIKIGADNSFSAGVSAEQRIFTGGKLIAGLKATKQGVAASEDFLQATINNVKFQVKQAFFSYLLADAVTKIQKDNVALNKEHLSTIDSRYKQGLDSDLVVLRQQVEVASAQTSFIQAKNLKEIAITNLQNLLGLDIQKELVLTGNLVSPQGTLPEFEAIVSTAIAHDPQYSALKKQLNASRSFYSIAKADRFPQVSAFGDYLWTAQSNSFTPDENQRNHSLGIGLKLDYKFFTGGELSQKIAQAKLDMKRSEEELEKYKRQALGDAKKYWLDVLEAQERALSQETAVGQAKRALNVTDIRYKAGRASQLELNDTSFALNRAQMIYAQASHDYWVNRAALERSIGISLEEIK